MTARWGGFEKIIGAIVAASAVGAASSSLLAWRQIDRNRAATVVISERIDKHESDAMRQAETLDAFVARVQDFMANGDRFTKADAERLEDRVARSEDRMHDTVASVRTSFAEFASEMRVELRAIRDSIGN